MIQSPLQLEQHFFTRIELQAHPEADPETQAQFETHVVCARHEDDPRRWMITLTAFTADDEESVSPYTGEIEIIGMFKVNDDYPEEKMAKMAHVNGAALLYGSVRELLANLTARGPFPQVMLPTATFIDECSSEGKKADDGPDNRQE